MGSQSDFAETLLCLFEVLVYQGVFALLEEEVVTVAGRDLSIYFRGVNKPLDLFIVVEGEQDGDLHDVHQRQVLLLDLLAEGPCRFEALQGVEQVVLEEGPVCSCSFVAGRMATFVWMYS